ncbi:MAG: hypothetical protein ABR979_04650 [Halobacteriota archaeon]
MSIFILLSGLPTGRKEDFIQHAYSGEAYHNVPTRLDGGAVEERRAAILLQNACGLAGKIPQEWGP